MFVIYPMCHFEMSIRSTTRLAGASQTLPNTFYVALKSPPALMSRCSSVAMEVNRLVKKLILKKSQIALFGMRQFVCGITFLINFASLSRYSLLHFHLLSRTTVHLHYHHSRLLSVFLSFIPDLRLGCLTNPFHHRLYHPPDGIS